MVKLVAKSGYPIELYSVEIPTAHNLVTGVGIIELTADQLAELHTVSEAFVAWQNKLARLAGEPADTYAIDCPIVRPVTAKQFLAAAPPAENDEQRAIIYATAEAATLGAIQIYQLEDGDFIMEPTEASKADIEKFIDALTTEGKANEAN